MFSWLTIKKIRKFSGFKVSAFIFFIYPIFVKSNILINVFYDETILIYLEIFDLNNIIIPLPFSLTILYIGSIFIFFGNIFFALLCPEPISKFSDYKEFFNTEMSNEYLISMFIPYVGKSDSDIGRLNRLSNSESKETKEIFSRLYIKVNKYRLWQSASILILFVVGFISLFVISLQNIYTSIIYIFT